MKRFRAAAILMCTLLFTAALAVSCGFFTMEVELIASPQEGPAPLTVDFLLKVDSFHHPDRYDWSFGGGRGRVSTNDNRNRYTYEQAGIYTASCSASQKRAIGNNFYEGDHLVITVTESGGEGLDVTITAEITDNPIEGMVELACSSTVSGGTAPYLYDWDFGDGRDTASYQSLANFYYYYSDEPASYTVQLAVTDDEGAQGVSNSVEVLVGGQGE